MTELEQLVAQKRELEEKIRALMDEGTVLGERGIKLAKKRGENAPWYIGVRSRDAYGTYERIGTHLRVIEADSRDWVIAQLPQLIADLQNLYDKIQRGK